MTREEVLVALKMDASQLDEQTKRSLSQLANVGKEHHKWWQHVGSEGRAYHKILENITDACPPLGNALKIALNPVVGTMLAAGAAIRFGIDALEEWHRKLLEISKVNLKPIGRGAEGIEAFYRERYEAMKEKRAELQEIDVEGGKSIWLDILKGAPFGKIIAKAIEDSRVEDAREQLKKMDANKGIADETAKRIRLDKELYDLDVQEFEALKKQHQEEDELNKLDEQRGANLKHRIELMDEYNHSYDKIQRQAEYARNAPYLPSISDLARTNTPYGYIAREELAAQNMSKQAMGLATPAELAAIRAQQASALSDLQSDVYNSPDGKSLSKAYQKYGERMQSILHGRSNADHNLEITAQAISDLNAQAKKDGLIVRGAD